MVVKNALDISLPSDLEIKMTREFDAPRELVFRAVALAAHEHFAVRQHKVLGAAVLQG